MHYDLTRLGPHSFEDLTRALFTKIAGPGVTVYGLGPDGGREAAFDGVLHLAGEEAWDGLTVLQAKFRMSPRDPADNFSWFVDEVNQEFARWADPISQRRVRGRLPDNLIIVTNVSLSSIAGGGIDKAVPEVATLAKKRGLNFRGLSVWPEQKVSALLDDSQDIRLRYSGLIMSGDVLGGIIDRLDLRDRNLAEALETHVVKEMLQARWVALDSAGQEVDRVSLASVGIDLPARPARQDDNVAALQWIIARCDAVRSGGAADGPSHVLLVGGPGQGKSTLVELLAQAYRVALLNDCPRLSGEASRLLAELQSELNLQGVPLPRNRRWPIRIELAAFAEWLLPQRDVSLLRYLAERVSSRSPEDINAGQLNRWLGRYPWLLILDGLDEVASPSARDAVVRGISDFLVDAAPRDADALVVVTTRPQGYTDELDPRDYARLDLVPLTPLQAIEYANRLSLAFHPDNPDIRAHIHSRLVEAADANMTSRLLRTPLQVNIMSRLLEGRERVPQQRYALFDSYFQVIYRREENKKGPVAKILEEHRNDVIWVHEAVALACHVRAENESEATASVSRDALRRLAVERLRKEGHDDEQAYQLAATIAVAALHRLVLLVPTGVGDSVGFEVRSLQEFMAARAITAADGPDIVARLQHLAPAAHWRNTWLFAAGYVFREREHLRDSVLAMLREIDVRDELGHLVLPGAELAMDIVDDGLAIGSPEKQRALALHALDILQTTPGAAWQSHADILLAASSDHLTREAILRRVHAALVAGGGPRALALLMLQRWKSDLGLLGSRARHLLSQHEPGPLALGLGLLRSGRTSEGSGPPGVTRKTNSMATYLERLVNDETRAARPLVRLFGASTVVERAVRRGDSGSSRNDVVWIVTEVRYPEVAAIEQVFARGDAKQRELTEAAVARLVDSIPPLGWHVTSVLRVALQRWLSRRNVGDGMVAEVFDVERRAGAAEIATLLGVTRGNAREA